jgi:hypothetical protein
LQASVKNQAAYAKEGTAANRKDWEDAEAALEKLASQISVSADGQDEEDKPLRNIASVLEDLRGNDWHVTQPSLYRHQKEGKIAPRRDGFYTLQAVDKYARVWLKQKSTGKKVKVKLEEFQVKRAANDIKLQDLDIEKKERDKAIAEGRLIPRDVVEIELAGRAGVLDAGIKHTIQAYSAEWIRTVGGDTNKVGEMIIQMTHRFDELMNSYASPLSYQFAIDAEEEATGEAPEIEGEPTDEEEDHADQCQA